MQTSVEYFSGEIKTTEKEEKKNLIIYAINASEGMIVDNRVTINDRCNYFDSNFDNKNVKMSDQDRVYLDKESDRKPKLDIPFTKTMALKQASAVKKPPLPPYDAKHHTLDKLLEPLQLSNTDALKKEGKKRQKLRKEKPVKDVRVSPTVTIKTSLIKKNSKLVQTITQLTIRLA